MKSWFSVCNLCTAGTSVVCMGAMGAAAGAAGAVAATGVAGMAGMGGMGEMADTEAAQAAVAMPFPTLLLEHVGLGFLNQVPDPVLRPIFVTLLLVSIGTAYLSFRTHKSPQALLLTALSGGLLYGSIYIWMSEPLYYASFTGMLGAALWGLFLARPGVRAERGKLEGSEERGSRTS